MTVSSSLPAPLADRRSTRGLRIAVAATAGFVAFWAYAGSVGLAGGGADPNGELTPHLPFHSPVFAALALTFVIAVPMTYTAVRATRDSADAALSAIGSGVLLIGWVTVQPFIIDRVFWLQPVCGVLGLVVAVLGVVLLRRRR